MGSIHRRRSTFRFRPARARDATEIMDSLRGTAHESQQGGRGWRECLLYSSPSPTMATTTTTVTESSSSDNGDASSSSPSSSPNQKIKKVSYELAARNIYYAKPVAAPRSLARLLKPACGGAAPPAPDYILRDVSLTAARGARSLPWWAPAARASRRCSIYPRGAHGADARPAAALNSHLRLRGVAAPPLVVVVDVAAAVAELLAELRLSHVAHTRVHPSRLSGGERRRACRSGWRFSVTPGWCSSTSPRPGWTRRRARVVVGCLRGVAAASRGTTVVLSIHQPSARILAAAVGLAFAPLSRGAVLHHGSLAALDAALLSYGLAVPAPAQPRSSSRARSPRPDPPPIPFFHPS
ncbi:hypothetical protein PR202_gb22960 [Eleusine coracana subsp. coracana]|uniref:ABC transporter domain-containing protein n=1 Tax=Eleusine coracana subsp. coracana TaxID=191504 RepID=A0AAV5FHM6_ELECO|nr:hypothetical protein PR202_gb22960 [Eleusine coracana subsp. coracana]